MWSEAWLPVLLTAAGCGVVRLAVGRRSRSPWLDALGWGPGLAFGLLSIVTFLALWIDLTALLWGLTILGFVAAAALARRLDRRVPGAWPSPPPPAHRGRLAGRVGHLLLLPTALGVGWAFLRFHLYRPYGTTDSHHIWINRALLLARGGDDAERPFELLVHGHPDYPLLYPGGLAGQFLLSGSESTLLTEVTGLLVLIGLGAVLYATVRRFAESRLAALATVFALCTPIVWIWSFGQIADPFVAYLFLATAAGLTGLAREGPSAALPPWLVGFFLGLLSWAKNEGIVLAGWLGAVFLYALWRWSDQTFRRKWRTVVSTILGALPGVSCFAIFKLLWVAHSETARFLTLGGGPLEKLLSPERWKIVLEAFARQLSVSNRWAYMWPALAVIAVLIVWNRWPPGRRSPAASSRRGVSFPRVGAVAVLGALALYTLAYLLSPYSLAWHTRASVDRLLLQIYPTLVATVFIAFHDPPAIPASMRKNDEPAGARRETTA